MGKFMIVKSVARKNPSFLTFAKRVSLALPVVALIVGAGGAGCTKQRPYEVLLKERVNDKALIDSQAEYLYVPSSLNSSRTASVSRPYWMGEAKLVKVRFTEKELQVLEAEQEKRFADNATNDKLVLSIPVEHVDYKCGENSVGECNNREEENNKITWSQKTKFKADFDGLSVQEVNTLPVELENLFSMGSCFPEKTHRVIDAKIEKDAINIDVERTYGVNLLCAEELESLSDLTFSVVDHYSLVKLDKVASPAYEPVLYPEADQGTFGFFTTDVKKLSGDNRDRQGDQKTLMNRWHSAKKEVVYHLSDNFNKPENAAVKKATYASIEAINDGLAKAGAGFKVVLKDEPGHNPGDIRDSMIVMVEDPTEAGLLGYGPTVANPKTGEILSGRVVMYLGIVKQYIRTVYEEVRQSQAEGAVKGKALSPALAKIQATFFQKARESAEENSAETVAPREERRASRIQRPSGLTEALARSRVDSYEIERFVKDYRSNVMPAESLRDRIAAASKHCLYMAEDFNFLDSLTRGIQERLNVAELKAWEELTEEERVKVMDVLIPYAWKPILVHEFGHNLGLRHNFQGSEDKANFYTREELAKMGIEQDLPYSSIMEYSARAINELRTMGKYDIAALRFGYARKVEDKEGNLIDVSGKTVEDLAKDQLKDFGFCTDEHVGINAGCRRFDEGTSYEEIAQNLIKMYEERYKMRNFRNGARSFSIMKDDQYAASIDSTFRGLRLFLEVRERINSRFKVTDQDWATVPFLVDLDKAVQLSAEFFLKVLATPDVLCIAAKMDDPNAPAELAPLSMLGPNFTSCYDPTITANLANAGYQIIAQGGKAFHSKKDGNNKNPYADQIDVRGIWIDKLLAAKYLLARQLGVSLLDEASENYLGYKGMNLRIKKLFAEMTLATLKAPVTFKTVDGQEIDLPVQMKMDVSNELMILKKMPHVRRALGLPDRDTLLMKEVIARMNKDLPHVLYGDESRAMTDLFSVVRSAESRGRKQEEFKSVQIGSNRLMALPENALASMVMDDLKVVRVLSQVSERRLAEILEELKAPKKDEPASAPVPAPGAPAEKPVERPEESQQEKTARELGPTAIERFLNGGYLSEEYMTVILEEILAQR